MMKSFIKFSGYILIKWMLFYAYQFIERGNKGKWWDHSTNKEGILLAAFMLLALPVIEIVVFIFPLQLALKQKGWLTVLILILAFALEFAIGWYATNQHLEVWMAVKIVLSMGLFYLMYRKQLNI